MIPGSVGVTITSMVAVAPGGSVPRSHSTSLVAGSKEYDPWLGVAETNFTPAGKESLTWGLMAKDSLLVSAMVKVTGSPTFTASALAVLVKVVSARVPACAVPAARTAIIIANTSTAIIRFFIFFSSSFIAALHCLLNLH